MLKKGTVTLEYAIDAKCLNCRHIEFPDIDVSEDADWGNCKLTNKQIDENHFCEEWEVYDFWNDLNTHITISQKHS